MDGVHKKLPPAQWVESDRIMMEDFNNAMASIESGLDSKAEKSAVTDMGEEITVVAQAVEAMASNLGSGGQTARIAWGNYTGTGTFGQNKPTSFSFDFKPIIMLFCEVDTRNTPSSTFLIRPNSCTKKGIFG